MRDATVRVVTADGARTAGRREGPPREPGHAELVVHRERFFARVLSQANLGMGEAWMDEDFSVPDGRLHDLLTILARARLDTRIRGDARLALRVLGIRARNVVRGGRGNVRAHFDLGDDLFEAFLDPTLTYTCGYARTADDDLAALQRQKLERICRKLRLRAGDRLLDVGCGYGGLLLYAAEHHGVVGTGVVNSRRHFERARERVQKADLADRIRIVYGDHRGLEGRFDKVVSVGVLEHLTRREHPEYFANVARVLAPGGMGLVHFIGCGGPVNEHDPFIQKYVFPGSCQPKLSEFAHLLERNRLAILDVENLIRHYALTCLRWLENFRRAGPRLDPSRYPAVFQRMFEYYLSCGVAAARASDGALYQILYTNDYAAEHPLQRI